MEQSPPPPNEEMKLDFIRYGIKLVKSIQHMYRRWEMAYSCLDWLEKRVSSRFEVREHMLTYKECLVIVKTILEKEIENEVLNARDVDTQRTVSSDSINSL